MDRNRLSAIYHNRNILVTGHTGFKGSWLVALLNTLGANVVGYSLEKDEFPLYKRIADKLNISDHRGDIRDSDNLKRVLKDASPDLIIHMAAQSLVCIGIENPLETYSVNVMGTAMVLQAAFEINRPVLAVSSDKCYRPDPRPRKVGDQLGGIDPYSASKAAMEMICMAQSQQSIIGVARAGNAIGGGDWAKSRLIPDYFRALKAGQSLYIRSPSSVRPWQYVLEPLWGYLMLGANLLNGKRKGAWNFGPERSLSVGEVLQTMGSFGPKINIEMKNSTLVENSALRLDSRRTFACLGWKNKLKTETALEWTVHDYLQLLNHDCSALDLIESRINEYATIWSGYD